MLFIHHHNDTEREEKPPRRLQRLARKLSAHGGLALRSHRGFINSAPLGPFSGPRPHINDVMATPDSCGSDYWEIVIEDSDL